jgi:hypothetical protein
MMTTVLGQNASFSILALFQYENEKNTAAHDYFLLFFVPDYGFAPARQGCTARINPF